MSQILSNRITLSVFSGFALFVCGTRAQATDISDTIYTTLTIYEDSELVGDVTCMVAGAPCIAFGAPGIKLHLNGFTITRRSQPFQQLRQLVQGRIDELVACRPRGHEVLKTLPSCSVRILRPTS